MKKFLAAFDGLNFSESTMQYAIHFSKKCNAHLVGVFLEDFTRHSYGMADITKYEGENFDQRISLLDEQDKEAREKAIELFEIGCQNAALNYSIHRNRSLASQELVQESIYADMLVISAGETMTKYEEPVPTRFIRDLLNEVQCPVLMVPAKFKPIEKLSLLYDGEPSSVHAVRMFSYLFEFAKSLPTEVITVKAADESLHMPDNKLIKEFIKRHYPNADYTVLKGSAEEEIIKYLKIQQKESIIVLGAYRRTRISRVFRASMADYLIERLKMPLFIAHNKS